MFINQVHTYLHKAGGPCTEIGVHTHRHLDNATLLLLHPPLFPPSCRYLPQLLCEVQQKGSHSALGCALAMIYG